jgi:hypothetical protein
MSRFQAMTNPVLDEELESIRVQLGLAESQRADLLRELAMIAGWVLRQVSEGRSIEARSGAHVESLRHPAFERLRSGASFAGERIVLYGGEAARLASILDRPFRPTAALRKALANLAMPSRRPPSLRWKPAKRRRRPT